MRFKSIIVIVLSLLITTSVVNALNRYNFYNFTSSEFLVNKNIQTIGNFDVTSTRDSSISVKNIINDIDSKLELNNKNGVNTYNNTITSGNVSMKLNAIAPVLVKSASGIFEYILNSPNISGNQMVINTNSYIGSSTAGLKFSAGEVAILSNMTPPLINSGLYSTEKFTFKNIFGINFNSSNSNMILDGSAIESAPGSNVNSIFKFDKAQRTNSSAEDNVTSNQADWNSFLTKAASVGWLNDDGRDFIKTKADDPNNPNDIAEFDSKGPPIDPDSVDPTSVWTWVDKVVGNKPSTYQPTTHAHSVEYKVVSGNCNHYPLPNNNKDSDDCVDITKTTTDEIFAGCQQGVFDSCHDTSGVNDVYLRCPKGMFIVAGLGNQEYSGCSGPYNDNCKMRASHPSAFPSEFFGENDLFVIPSVNGDLASGWIVCAGTTEFGGPPATP